MGGNGDWYREGGGNHNGNINKNVNERIRMAGGRRGLVIDGLSRLMTTEDLKDSVVIVVMDNLVLEEMKKASKVWGVKWEEKGVAEIRKVSEFFLGCPWTKACCLKALQQYFLANRYELLLVFPTGRL